MRIDDDSKVVKFSEMLIEAGSGFTSGGGYMMMESHLVLVLRLKVTILLEEPGKEISKNSQIFLVKNIEYKFDYKEIRSKVEEAAKSADYRFEYQILPIK